MWRSHSELRMNSTISLASGALRNLRGGSRPAPRDLREEPAGRADVRAPGRARAAEDVPPRLRNRRHVDRVGVRERAGGQLWCQRVRHARVREKVCGTNSQSCASHCLVHLSAGRESSTRSLRLCEAFCKAHREVLLLPQYTRCRS